MTPDVILERISSITRMHNTTDPYLISIDELATDLNIKRCDLISFLVDLKLAGQIEFDRSHVHLSASQGGSY